jgi:4-alpha-glucanotransferase
VIPADGSARSFLPAEETDQLAQGERVMRAFLSSGAYIIAEDLGTVPDFVRASLLDLGIPGYKVLRWERDWDDPGQPFRDPLAYPPVSIATTGTHDTETMVEWWEGGTDDERTALAEIPFVAERQVQVSSATCDRAIQDTLLEMLIASSSDLLILPMQDLFGWRDRVNVPATVSDDNWTWRLPWPVDELATRAEVHARSAQLRRWIQASDRSRALFTRPDACQSA